MSQVRILPRAPHAEHNKRASTSGNASRGPISSYPTEPGDIRSSPVVRGQRRQRQHRANRCFHRSPVRTSPTVPNPYRSGLAGSDPAEGAAESVPAPVEIVRGAHSGHTPPEPCEQRPRPGGSGTGARGDRAPPSRSPSPRHRRCRLRCPGPPDGGGGTGRQGRPRIDVLAGQPYRPALASVWPWPTAPRSPPSIP